MSENPPGKWQELKNVLKSWLAGLVVRWCGLESIYWASPKEWEKYMSEGKTPVFEDAVYYVDYVDADHIRLAAE